MAWSGGTFTRTNGVNSGATVWATDAAAGVKIRADRHDTHDQDLATGINQCLNKDGSNYADAINLGHATDTTFTRPAAGRAQIEGREIVTAPASATVLTSTIAELNILDGVTATAAELNILDGVTATADELNQIDGFGLKGYITGFVPTAAADADHDLTFSSGACRNAADTISCKPAWSTLTKQIDAAFAEGTNAGGMATGSVANSTAYYYNLIRKDSDPTVFDICIDVSSSNANTPSGWTFMREIHREFTDGSANLRVQTYSEMSGGGIRSKFGTVLTAFTDSNPGTNLVTKTIPCPPGVEVRGTVTMIDASLTAVSYMVFTEVGSTATEPDVNNYTSFINEGIYVQLEVERVLDSSRNLEYELSSSTADHSIWFQIFSWKNHRRN